MAGPQLVDVHMHIYRSQEWGARRLANYSIGEYGEKENVTSPASNGSAEEAIQDIADAGFYRAVVANMFVEDQARDYAIFNLDPNLTETQRAAAITEIESSSPALLREFNYWGCDLAAENECLVPFVAVDPNTLPGEEGAAHLRELVEGRGAKGVKVHPALQKFEMTDPRMWPIYRVCQELGVPFLSHSGPSSDGVSYAEPRSFAPVLEAFPNLKFIIAHMGGATWEQALDIGKAFPNAYFDSCEVIEWTGAPKAPTDEQLAQLIRDIGPSRVMMGSDYPWYGLTRSVDRIMELPILTDGEREAILGANAIEILGL